MAGMYEKLGDLLNETLEAGRVKFVHIEREEPTGEAEGGTEGSRAEGQVAEEESSGTGENFSRQKEADFADSFYRAETEAEKRYFKTSRSSEAGESRSRRVIYRRITPELEKAFSLLGLESTTDKDAVKKAYKEKLLYYHPDRYAGKEVMEKVANDKTREVVAAYRLIMETI